METIRENLVDLINELNKLLILTKNPEEEDKIRQARRVGLALLEEVIKQEIKSNTREFREAIASLKEAQEAVEAAKQDIKKISDAINRTVLAAKAVDKIVKLGIGLLA
jgi:hypothetical protein